LNRGLAFLALAGLAALPRALCSQSAPQSVPEALKESALAVRVFAIVPTSPTVNMQAPDAASPNSEGQSSQPAPATKDKGADWQVQSVKYTVPGSPVPFKFVGANLAVLVQVTPFIRRDAPGLVLVTQGQIWVKNKEGTISYRTAINTLSVNYGEKVYFFPLGLDASGKAPLRLEIAVYRAAELPEAPADATSAPDEKSGGPADKAPSGDKSPSGDKTGK
jgi:hypothetical protein